MLGMGDPGSGASTAEGNGSSSNDATAVSSPISLLPGRSVGRWNHRVALVAARLLCVWFIGAFLELLGFDLLALLMSLMLKVEVERL